MVEKVFQDHSNLIAPISLLLLVFCFSIFFSPKRKVLSIFFIFISLCLSVIIGNYILVENYVLSLIYFFMLIGLFFCLIDKQSLKLTFLMGIILGGLGSILILDSNYFLALILGIEMTSLALYFMVKSHDNALIKLEFLKKYLIWALITTALFIFSWSWLYAYSGVLSFKQTIPLQQNPLSHGMIIFFMHLLLMVFFFKLMIFPVYFWAYSFFNKANIATILFIATLPKIAMAFGLIKILASFQLYRTWIDSAIIILSIITIVIAALNLIHNSNIRTALINSILISTGFIILPIMIGLPVEKEILSFYLLSSCISLAGMYLCLYKLESASLITKTNRLLNHRKGFIVFFVLFTLSLIGIPITIGFWGKFWIFFYTLSLDVLSTEITILLILCFLSIIILLISWIRISQTVFNKTKNLFIHFSFFQIVVLLLLSSIIVLGGLYVNSWFEQ